MKLKDLLNIAKGELAELSNIDNPDFRLEEARFNEAEAVWEIVVSFLVENKNRKNNPISVLNDLPFERLYKRLTISSDNTIGELAMYKG